MPKCLPTGDVHLQEVSVSGDSTVLLLLFISINSNKSTVNSR